MKWGNGASLTEGFLAHQQLRGDQLFDVGDYVDLYRERGFASSFITHNWQRNWNTLTIISLRPSIEIKVRSLQALDPFLYRSGWFGVEQTQNAILWTSLETDNDSSPSLYGVHEISLLKIRRLQKNGGLPLARCLNNDERHGLVSEATSNPEEFNQPFEVLFGSSHEDSGHEDESLVNGGGASINQDMSGIEAEAYCMMKWSKSKSIFEGLADLWTALDGIGPYIHRKKSRSTVLRIDTFKKFRTWMEVLTHCWFSLSNEKELGMPGYCQLRLDLKGKGMFLCDMRDRIPVFQL